MQLVAFQLDIQWENREANHRQVRAMLEASPPEPGSLVALPEMFSSGFSMNVAGIAEDESRATERFLCDIARDFQITVVGGLVTRCDDGRGRNEAVVATQNSIIARYSKLHPYAPSGEKTHFQAGDGVVRFDWNGARVAPLICYDLRFPEAFRLSARRGVDVFVVIASWPSARVEHWITLLRARAIENQAYVMGVNRFGWDPNLTYPGRSLIVDYRGEVLADAGADEGRISAPVDLAALRAYRRELPFLQDIRDDLLPR
jgi:predicted amidohydrolase